KQHNSAQFFSDLDNIIKEYIGSKLYLPSRSLTTADVETHLKNNGVDSKTVLFTIEILKLCEMSEYASSKDINKKVAIAFKDSKKVLKWIEKELK
ncbi:MAG: hypothetical protein AB1782_11420, partial [Cyanobacteriota bacterium]